MNSNQKQRMIDFLEETIEHYNINNRSTKGGTCVYKPPTGSLSEGCAIGRKLPKSYKKRLNKVNNTLGVKNLFMELGTPKFFSGMDIDILCQIQILHDCSSYWDEEGFIERFRHKVDDIKEQIQNN